MKQSSADIDVMGLMIMAGENPSDILISKENQGQSWVRDTVKIPRKNGYRSFVNESIDVLKSLGITVTETPNDELFFDAVLPEGWRIEPTEHHMWSDVIDEKGVKRISMFYKAAFYDRDAFYKIITTA
jgi:hypothetical protein